MIDWLNEHMVPCVFKKNLGIECPGCGLQRSLIALLQGDILLSIRMNASLIPFIITVLFTIFHISFNFKNGARTIVWLFSTTVFIMVLHFVIKLISAHP